MSLLAEAGGAGMSKSVVIISDPHGNQSTAEMDGRVIANISLKCSLFLDFFFSFQAGMTITLAKVTIN